MVLNLRQPEDPEADELGLTEGVIDLIRQTDRVIQILPPEIQEPEIPQWYINFENSDRRLGGNAEADGEPAGNPQEPDVDAVAPDLMPETSMTWQIIRRYDPNIRRIEANVGNIPEYHQPQTNIQIFNAQFPIPPKLYRRWKDGIRLWPTKSFSKARTKAKEPGIHKEIIQRLLDKEIVTETVAGPYSSGMFYILKGEGEKLRPIFNYKHLTKALSSPHFNLPSLYQIIDRYEWPRNLYYVKLDFKQAFFNINIHPKSKFITTVKVEGSYYSFNFLPFGISIAPFVCQQLVNTIVRWLRTQTPWVWGHIDDLIIGAREAEPLILIVKELLHKLTLAKWIINVKKSVLIPTKTLTFLGATWTNDGVERLEARTQDCKIAIQSINLSNTIKDQQKLRGFLNYYLSFAGKVHSIVNRVILNGGIGKKYLYALLHFKKIRFKDPCNDPASTVFTDATTTRLGWCCEYGNYTSSIYALPIIEAETLAAICGVAQLVIHGHRNIDLYTDNMATLYFFKKGTARAFTNAPLDLHYLYLYNLIILKLFIFRLKVQYINTSINPADALTRLGG